MKLKFINNKNKDMEVTYITPDLKKLYDEINSLKMKIREQSNKLYRVSHENEVLKRENEGLTNAMDYMKNKNRNIQYVELTLDEPVKYKKNKIEDSGKLKF